MIEIECLACGKLVKIPTFIDTKKYEGQVTCQECNSLLYVKLVQEKVQKYKIVQNKREHNVELLFVPANSKEAQNGKKRIDTVQDER